MPRPVAQETEAVNADSFLDIVASVVSILIIMVLMVGMRIKSTAVDTHLSIAAVQSKSQLEKDVAVEQSLRGDVLKLVGETEEIQRETAIKGQQREVMVTMASAMEHEIDARRGQMDSQSQGQFDIARSVAQSRARLEELRRSKIQVETAEPAAVVVESYPTPISRAVDDSEVHFQIRRGCIVYIPLERLIEQFKGDAQRQVDKLRHDAEVTETVGPVGGFRLQYTMERRDVEADLSSRSRGGSYARLTRWTVVPESDDMGEAADEALAPNSAFHKALSKIRPGRTTITVWVYADSFDAFRQIRKELYRLGYPVAARPLPMDVPISGSPEGSKSAAQ
jgi:hypothetical protein